jgi:hypothetical protein
MANKRHKPEEIVQKLRQVDVLVGQGMQRVDAIREVRIRGPCGANDEFLLAATAQNLRKLAKIFPAPQQTRKA